MGSVFQEHLVKKIHSVHRRRPQTEADQASEPPVSELDVPIEEVAAARPKAPVHEPLLDSDLLGQLAEMDQGDFGALMSQAIGDAPMGGAELSPGTQVSGIVVRRTNMDVFVSVGAKHEATLDAAESDAQVGDRIEAFVLTSDHRGVRLATRLRGAQALEHLESAQTAGLPVEGRVTERNAGGYVVDLGGVRAFCPSSHMALRPSDPDSYIGKTLDFQILEVGKREAVVSRRAIEEAEAEKNAATFWKGVSKGAKLEGPVVSVQTFGVFVDLGPVQGLVPRSKLDDAEPQVGDSLKVKVIALDPTAGKITLEPASRSGGTRSVHKEQGSLGTFADLFGKL
jgi:small subunit ribosomal protein S1